MLLEPSSHVGNHVGRLSANASADCRPTRRPTVNKFFFVKLIIDFFGRDLNLYSLLKSLFSTFSYKLVQISPIMILVNSGAFLSISSWFCELTELIFVMIPYISSTGYPPKTQGIMGHVQVAN